jgi:hypothetical protein
MRLKVFAAAVLALGGCSSVEDVRQKPALWSAVYSTSFDRMTNCLISSSIDAASVTPQLYPSEKLAVITLGVKGSYGTTGEFRVREVAPGQVDVDYRGRTFASTSAATRSIADACAKSA